MGGGVPRGRILEVYGDAGSGKTTLAATIIKAFQQAGHKALFVDFEHAIDPYYFKAIGVNMEELVMISPEYMEQGIDASLALIRSGEVGVVVYDSVASMVPKAELEGTTEDYSIGLQARKMGQALRILTGTIDKAKTSVIFVNQLRSKIGANPFEMRVDPNTTPGGKALKFYASIRLEMKKSFRKDEGRPIHVLTLRKQKTCDIQKAAAEMLIGANGIDADDHFIRSLVNIGVLEGKGPSYFFDGTSLGKRTEVPAKIFSTPDLLERVIQKHNAIRSSTQDGSTLEP